MDWFFYSTFVVYWSNPIPLYKMPHSPIVTSTFFLRLSAFYLIFTVFSIFCMQTGAARD